ncbi:hypothetical protein IRZ71_08285 [Flavobacterium sp. ANB]|uniref:hypothetical protein n=1 Tax=unclassified Flavobacterium TaxID=196869 RepID=UPI0012B87D02|nr:MULTISPECIES: hypothetical protein [unclassified Flavobacterium]MBF4516337.1 hypothetical protein [Flavobacterium sp. ANB]MTD69766.1 hypothetical protein [Flavobacterium sp. LC2016-13]
MNKLTKLNLIGVILFLVSCSSMSPLEVNNTLPALTKSKFISQAQAQESINSNECKFLVQNRNYAAPIGMFPKDDLKNAAKGIDEWVQLDGGNAYVLKNYKWVTVDKDGTTQLHVDFDTLLCK